MSLDLFFFDIDGDELEYSVLSTRDDIASITIENDSLIILPLLNKFSDPFSASITASDGELEVSQSFFVEVLPDNDPPTANSGDEVLNEDNLIAIVLTGEDIEFDPLSYIIYQLSLIHI